MVFMPPQTFLVGNRREKKIIERLLISGPVPISYDYLYLCIILLEYLIDADIKNNNDFDNILCEYLDSMEIDIEERIGASQADIKDYSARVKKALQYLKLYLNQLDWIPLPRGIHLKAGRGNTVLTLYTI